MRSLTFEVARFRLRRRFGAVLAVALFASLLTAVGLGGVSPASAVGVATPVITSAVAHGEQVDLAWRVDGVFTGVNIYRNDGYLKSVNAPQMSFSVPGGEVGDTYKMIAYASNNQYSGWSAPVVSVARHSQVAPNTVPPPASSGNTATKPVITNAVASAGQVHLEWRIGGPVRGFNIYRNNSWVKSVNSPSTSTSIQGGQVGDIYKMIPYAGTNSDWSDPVASTNGNAVPRPNINAAAWLTNGVGTSYVSLNWRPNSDAQKYEIFRNGLPAGIVIAPGNALTDVHGKPGDEYRVRTTTKDGRTSELSAPRTIKNGNLGHMAILTAEWHQNIMGATYVSVVWTPQLNAKKYKVYRNGIMAGEVVAPGNVLTDLKGEIGDSYRVQAVNRHGGNPTISRTKKSTFAAPEITAVSLRDGRADRLFLEWTSDLNNGQFTNRYFEVEVVGSQGRKISATDTQISAGSTEHTAGIELDGGISRIRVRVAQFATAQGGGAPSTSLNWSPWSEEFVFAKFVARSKNVPDTLVEITQQLEKAQKNLASDAATAGSKGAALVINIARPGTPLGKGKAIAVSGNNFSKALEKARKSNDSVQEKWNEFREEVARQDGPDIPDPINTHIDDSVNIDRLVDFYGYMDYEHYKGKTDAEILADITRIMTRDRTPRPPSHACTSPSCMKNTDSSDDDGYSCDSSCRQENEAEIADVYSGGDLRGEFADTPTTLDDDNNGGSDTNDHDDRQAEEDEEDEEEKDDTPTENPHTK